MMTIALRKLSFSVIYLKSSANYDAIFINGFYVSLQATRQVYIQSHLRHSGVLSVNFEHNPEVAVRRCSLKKLFLKSDSCLPKKIVLFSSMKALQK